MKWLKIHVTRETFTDLYAQVPDDFELAEIGRSKYSDAIVRLARDTTESMDWCEWEWPNSVRVVDAVFVPENDARDYAWGTLIDDGVTDG